MMIKKKYDAASARIKHLENHISTTAVKEVKNS